MKWYLFLLIALHASPLLAENPENEKPALAVSQKETDPYWTQTAHFWKGVGKLSLCAAEFVTAVAISIAAHHFYETAVDESSRVGTPFKIFISSIIGIALTTVSCVTAKLAFSSLESFRKAYENPRALAQKGAANVETKEATVVEAQTN